MKCKKCNKEIKEVLVYSECYQKAQVNKKGEITDYDSVEEITETTAILHNEADCFNDVIDFLTQ